MSDVRENLITPVGRIVSGSLYIPQTKDAEGRPLFEKDGSTPKVKYFFALAIPKGSEQHWSQTPWGQLIYKAGVSAFPQVAQSRNFAWKVVDGDSTDPNSKGVRPCDREGYPGHWVLSFSSKYAPKIFRDRGTVPLTTTDAVSAGDYVEVSGSVVSNKSTQQPGVIINHQFVNFVGYGQRIVYGPAPDSVGFTGVLPPGASATPLSTGFNPAPAPVSTVTLPPAQIPNATPGIQINPHPAILQPHNNHATTAAPMPPMPQAPVAPPVPAAPVIKQLTPAAGNFTYEQYKARNWTDEQLIAAGFLRP